MSSNVLKIDDEIFNNSSSDNRTEIKFFKTIICLFLTDNLKEME